MLSSRRIFWKFLIYCILETGCWLYYGKKCPLLSLVNELPFKIGVVQPDFSNTQGSPVASYSITSPVCKAWLSHDSFRCVSAIFPTFLREHLMHCFYAGTSGEDWLKVQALLSLWYLSRPRFPNSGLASGNCFDQALEESLDARSTSVCRSSLEALKNILTNLCGSPPY